MIFKTSQHLGLEARANEEALQGCFDGYVGKQRYIVVAALSTLHVDISNDIFLALMRNGLPF